MLILVSFPSPPILWISATSYLWSFKMGMNSPQLTSAHSGHSWVKKTQMRQQAKTSSLSVIKPEVLSDSIHMWLPTCLNPYEERWCAKSSFRTEPSLNAIKCVMSFEFSALFAIVLFVKGRIVGTLAVVTACCQSLAPIGPLHLTLIDTGIPQNLTWTSQKNAAGQRNDLVLKIGDNQRPWRNI